MTSNQLACMDSVKRDIGGRPSVNDTHIVFCIDVSSSMKQFSQMNILDSINKLISEQKKNSNVLVKNSITIIKFGSEVSVVYERVNLNDMSKVEYSDITPNGTTSLYDAIGLGLSKFKDVEDNMFMILTDGMENTSKKETIESVRSKIKEANSNKCLVKYLGGGCDAIRFGVNMGFPEESCLTFTNCDEGFKNALNSLSCSLSRHRSNENHAFTGLERAQSIKTIKTIKTPPILGLQGLQGLQTPPILLQRV
jgi:hypothetical protein